MDTLTQDEETIIANILQELDETKTWQQFVNAFVSHADVYKQHQSIIQLIGSYSPFEWLTIEDANNFDMTDDPNLMPVLSEAFHQFSYDGVAVPVFTKHGASTTDFEMVNFASPAMTKKAITFLQNMPNIYDDQILQQTKTDLILGIAVKFSIKLWTKYNEKYGQVANTNL